MKIRETLSKLLARASELLRESENSLDVVAREKFEGKEIDLCGKHWVSCRFIDCTFVIGAAPFRMGECIIEGNAELDVDLITTCVLRNLYELGQNSDAVKKKIRELLNTRPDKWDNPSFVTGRRESDPD